MTAEQTNRGHARVTFEDDDGEKREILVLNTDVDDVDEDEIKSRHGFDT